jgi:maltose alpha-D-glucosyltransferase/alpha-amylase
MKTEKALTTEELELLSDMATDILDTKKDNRFWYKDMVLYALQVRSFYDSNADGIGDFPGLTQKLDYLTDLGINAVWLLPFYPSPMKDDGYDVSDFCDIHPDYGTLEQFKTFLKEAKKRDIKVIIEMVLNHTSDKHEWFKRAKLAEADSNERDFYIWSDTQDKFKEARILFPDYEASNWAWDFTAKRYYFHRFFSSMPDLNYDNIEVQKEMIKVVDFWLEMGVDGMILSSAAYLFKREGTNCENLPEVHHFLKKVRQYVDFKHPNKVLLSEVNLWPEDVAEYYGKGDEMHINFHFPLMPRLFMAIQTEDRFPIVDILQQTPKIPENAQWSLFLRNHNEMTLEMVTDEERDYLRQALAQDPAARLNKGIRRRLSRLVGNDRRKFELLNILMFSLPGAPTIYYGDEIGMGDNIYLGDRNGVRTPMQWDGGLNAGFSDANPQKLFLPIISDPLYRHEAVNVANQQRNLASVLWWTKRAIAVRQRWKAFSRGAMTFVPCENNKILAFTRQYQGETVLVVVNLSSYPQAGKLDLGQFKGYRPVEIFSQNKFFSIKDDAYPIVLAPFGYYWFSLENEDLKEQEQQYYKIPQITMDGTWRTAFENFSTRSRFEKQVLENYMMQSRWFDGKSKKIVTISVENAIPVDYEVGEIAYLLQIQVRYTTGLPDTYSLPVTYIKGDAVTHYEVNYPKSIICEVLQGEGRGIVIDAMSNVAFTTHLFNQMTKTVTTHLQRGALHFLSGKRLKALNCEASQVKSRLLSLEQSNTSVLYTYTDENGKEHEFFFKLYRKLEFGLNPELELVRFLSENTSFKNAPSFAGGLEFKETPSSLPLIFGLLQEKIPNQGDAWPLMLDALDRFYQQVFIKSDKQKAPKKSFDTQPLDFEALSVMDRKLITSLTYEWATKLGVRTGEMHLALASDAQNPDFKPEEFSKYYQRSLYAAHRKLVDDKFSLLEQKISNLPLHVKKSAKAVLDMKSEILDNFKAIFSQKIDATKTRVHGDYHLGQVLFNGKDFFIIDFEGEPNATMGERRLKRTPFKDVAGMLRSFHYAAYGKILMSQSYQKNDRAFMESWAALWFHYVSRFYLTAYFKTVGNADFIPKNEVERDLLLRTYLLEKAVYEMGYELNSRPDWLMIPLTGILDIMKENG